MATSVACTVRGLAKPGRVRAAAILLLAVAALVLGCKKKAASEGPGEGTTAPAPAAEPAAAEPGGAGDVGSAAAEPVGEAASAARVEACLRRGEGCDELSLAESGALLQRSCREAGGTKCDRSGEDMVATLDVACTVALGRACSPADPEYRRLLEGVWGVPECAGGQLEERPKLRFPVSLSREPLADGAQVEVQEDAIYCNGARSALLREENGVRVVDERAKLGGKAGYLIEQLRAQLSAYRAQRREAALVSGTSTSDVGSAVLIADRATPVRVLKEVLYTAREAGCERLQLAVKRTPVGRDPAELPFCDRFAAVSFSRGSAAGAAALAPAEGGAVTGPQLQELTAQIESTLSLESILGRAPGSEGPSGGESGAAPAAPSARALEEAVSLGLVVILTKGAMTVMVGRDVTADVLPEDPATGTRGRADIPHLRLSADEVAQQRTAACSPPAGEGGAACVYLTYLASVFDSCFEGAAGPVKVPDLLRLNVVLGELAGRIDAAYPGGLADRWQIKVKSEDDIPVCQLVGVLDVVRFRDLGFDWTADAAFRSRCDELRSQGVQDPLSEPVSFDPALRSAFLFPAIVLVD